MKPEDIEITEEIASRIEIFVRLTEVEHEAYKGRQPMTQDLFNSISKKIAPINTDLWIEFISNYAAFLPDDPEEEMEDDMEWNPPEDAKSKEQMLAEIKAGIAVAFASDLDVGEGVCMDGILRQSDCYLVPSSDPVLDVRRRG